MIREQGQAQDNEDGRVVILDNATAIRKSKKNKNTILTEM
jgi:hypothetical protein